MCLALVQTPSLTSRCIPARALHADGSSVTRPEMRAGITVGGGPFAAAQEQHRRFQAAQVDKCSQSSGASPSS